MNKRKEDIKMIFLSREVKTHFKILSKKKKTGIFIKKSLV